MTETAVADKLFSFLPHRCQPLGGGASVSVDATSMNPGFFTSTGVTQDATLQAIVKRRVLEEGITPPLHPELRGLRFALVDMTKDKQKPLFAGHNETVQGGIGSLCKTACMYAAYQLKFDLEELAKQKGLTSETDLFKAARDIWSDTQKRDAKNVKQLFPSNPKIELFGSLVEVDGKQIIVPRHFSSPDLEQMFTVTSAGGAGVTVRFKGSDLVLVDPSVPGSPPHTSPNAEKYVHAKGEDINQVRKLTFAERLFLMIDESDNAATETCIANVSFLFLHSALWQSDIYRPERGGGMWEASTHRKEGTRWVTPVCSMPPVPRPRRPPVPQGFRPDFVSATAASVAALFTLIEQDRLVNPNSCTAMRQLTSKAKVGLKLPRTGGGLRDVPSYTRSFFRPGLSGLRLDRFHSKLGIGDFNNDGALVVRTVTDPLDATKKTVLRYAATGFDDKTDDGSDLATLMTHLDKCIQENNGLIKATDP